MTHKYPIRRAELVAAAEFDTPIGPMTAAATARGLAVLWFDGLDRHAEALATVPRNPAQPHLVAARRWLDAYWRGDDAAPPAVPLDLHGTLFQRSVWQQLLRIPRGHTRTYGEVAARVGNGAVPRATGAACGANPVAVIVPCHRVVGANGSLTGFAGGLPRKQALLQHEGALLV